MGEAKIFAAILDKILSLVVISKAKEYTVRCQKNKEVIDRESAKPIFEVWRNEHPNETPEADDIRNNNAIDIAHLDNLRIGELVVLEMSAASGSQSPSV